MAASIQSSPLRSIAELRTGVPAGLGSIPLSLGGVHAFFRYVAVSEPGLALHCQRILAIPSKRYDRGPVAFLTEKEPAALVAAPNPKTWIGKRDRALLLVAVQTGLRNSEITSLRCQDVELGAGTHVRCLGKGRKMRCTPLRPDVTKILEDWMSQQAGKPEDPLFPSSNGGRLSADGLQQLVARHIATARKRCPSLASKTVTPHTLRLASHRQPPLLINPGHPLLFGRFSPDNRWVSFTIRDEPNRGRNTIGWGT